MVRSFAHKGLERFYRTGSKSGIQAKHARRLVIEPLGLSVTAAARHLGVSRKTLSKVLNCRGAITAEMALRLEMTFGRPDAAHWLRLQTAHDLWQTRQRSPGIHVTAIEAQAA